MALERVSTRGTGKHGHRSERWAPRADVKRAAAKRRRIEGRRASKGE